MAASVRGGDVNVSVTNDAAVTSGWYGGRWHRLANNNDTKKTNKCHVLMGQGFGAFVIGA